MDGRTDGWADGWMGYKLPVIIIAAVNTRLSCETGQGRIQGPATLAAAETVAVPGAFHRNEIEPIGDL